MSEPTRRVPRDVQSDLHDMADKIEERVAEEDMVEINYETPLRSEKGARCTCERYSEDRIDGTIFFWNEEDPNCSYRHLQPLPQDFSITVA